MFRVLSEEESRKAVRWRAPELNKPRKRVANTREVVTSLASTSKEPVSAQFAHVPLPTTTPQRHTSAPELQAIHPVAAASTTIASLSEVSDMPVAQTANPAGNGSPESATANVPLPNPSADMLQSSYDEGYTRGWDEGQARGFAEGNAALHQQSITRLNSVVAALENSRLGSGDSALEQEVLSLSLEIARVLLHREISVDPDAMAMLVRQGLQQLPGNREAMREVRLHPLDAKEIRQLMIDTDRLDIIDDADLAQGDCIVECASSVVHAGIDQWLETMASQLGIFPKADELLDSHDDSSAAS